MATTIMDDHPLHRRARRALRLLLAFGVAVGACAPASLADGSAPATATQVIRGYGADVTAVDVLGPGIQRASPGTRVATSRVDGRVVITVTPRD